jgi:TetR/AcrR family transcriptional regulator, transcriptional repressor for nem operon
MARSGAQTREKLLDAAEGLIFDHGFSATSVDRVIERAGVTKGAFFHHFKTKAELGRAVIQRHAEREMAYCDRILARAERLAGDPLQQVLIFVGLLLEDYEDLQNPVPGCLFASYLYQRLEYPAEVAKTTARTLAYWRDAVARKLRQAAEDHPLKADVSPADLADTLLAVIEGSYVLSKAKSDPDVLRRQLRHYRSHLALIFGMDAAQASRAAPGPRRETPGKSP